jgi:predicted MFS family arabinose efflux permease
MPAGRQTKAATIGGGVVQRQITGAAPGRGSEIGRGAAPGRGATMVIVATVLLNAVEYLLIGLPLAVLPGFVHFTLGYGATLAGFLISLQYAATLLSRAAVGRACDTLGPKKIVLGGLACAIVSGLCILAASRGGPAWAVLLWLCVSRLWLGTAESCTGTGCIAWGIGRVGAAHTAEVMSWNGVASYGGIALGAPVGVWLNHVGGLAALGWFSAGLAVLGIAGGLWQPGVAIVAGVRMRMGHVLRRVLPFGGVLALASAGFGTIVAFITLYYDSRHWGGAQYALSAFGLAFVAVRVCLAGAIRRIGGYRCAAVSLLFEAAGLAMLFAAPTPAVALLGATFTGLGLSLIFPAMAVEALRDVEPANSGAAIGVYTVFLDLSLGITGPLAGALIGQLGYASVYLLGAVAAAMGELLTLIIWRRARARPPLPAAAR